MSNFHLLEQRIPDSQIINIEIMRQIYLIY